MQLKIEHAGIINTAMIMFLRGHGDVDTLSKAVQTDFCKDVSM